MGLLARQRRDVIKIGVALLAYVAAIAAANWTLNYVLKSVLNLDYGLGG